LPVIVAPLAVILFWNDATDGYPLRETPVTPPTGADARRATLRIDGDADGDAVIFDHARHQADFGQDDSCQTCHHVYLPGDPQTACHRCHSDMFRSRRIFDHEWHTLRVGRRKLAGLPRELYTDSPGAIDLAATSFPAVQAGFARIRSQNQSCAECHPVGHPKSGRTAVACGTCHGSEMGLSPAARTSFGAHAVSYTEAMHGRCIACHVEQAAQRDRPELAECRTCHPADADRPCRMR
jgi:hypothetical protein